MQEKREKSLVGSDFSMYEGQMYDVRWMYDLVKGRFRFKIFSKWYAFGEYEGSTMNK